jgi:hypothetical protein
LASWSLASLVGWAAGIALGALLTVVGSRLLGLNEDRAGGYIVLLSVGLVCGATQSWVLRSYLPDAWRWIPATLAGCLLALVVSAAVSAARIAVTDPLLSGVIFGVIGAAIGVPQWLLLRQHLRGTGLWALATAAGFLIFLWLVANPANSLREIIGKGALLGALTAVPPGAVLTWVVRRD